MNFPDYSGESFGIYSEVRAMCYAVKTLGQIFPGLFRAGGEDKTVFTCGFACGENTVNSSLEDGVFKITGDSQRDGQVKGANKNAINPFHGHDGFNLCQAFCRLALRKHQKPLVAGGHKFSHAAIRPVPVTEAAAAPLDETTVANGGELCQCRKILGYKNHL